MRRHAGTQFDSTLINELEDWTRHDENGTDRDAASVQPIAPGPDTADPAEVATAPSERQPPSAQTSYRAPRDSPDIGLQQRQTPGSILSG